MSSFTTPLVVEDLGDGKNWRVYSTFEYHVGSEESFEVILVPKGFVTDFASIPRLFWSLLGDPTGPYGKAAVVHDYLYRSGGKLPGRTYTKKEADAIFYEAMGVLGVGKKRRWLMWKAVSWFGSGSFQGVSNG